MILTPSELTALSGGYVRPTEQYKALRTRYPLTAWVRGAVILTHAHVQAVDTGVYQKPVAAQDGGPKVRLVRAA